ncbi:uncharacterized protein FFC1_08634 [Fusarium fujikuroi]|nr:uncharacterized protein FFC1_08634 [Fusarium fujikuroi]
MHLSMLHAYCDPLKSITKTP